MSDVIGSSIDIQQNGCPHCGCTKGYTFLDSETYIIWVCTRCSRKTMTMKIGDIKLQDPKDCGGCDDAKIFVIDRGRFDTPGCFCAGGDSKERHSIVIQARCPKQANRIVTRLFPMGAFADAGYVIVGADDMNRIALQKLDQLIGQYQAISNDIVAQAKRVSSILPRALTA